MGDLAESLPQVLDQIGIASKCIAIGEGAGADIVCRFAVRIYNKYFSINF
jgi:hypothetical protein